MDYSGIYLITSPSFRMYIGQSKNLYKRYRYYMSVGAKSQSRLHNSFVKYGFENHSFQVLMKCDLDDLNKWEAFYIKFFDTFNTSHGLNLRSGGDVSKQSNETIARMSKAQKGKTISEETKIKLSLANIGYKRPEADKIKISQAMSGKVRTKDHNDALVKSRVKNGGYAKSISAMSEAKKKKVIDTETGIIYSSASEASLISGYTYNSFIRMLKGRRNNKTNFTYQ